PRHSRSPTVPRIHARCARPPAPLTLFGRRMYTHPMALTHSARVYGALALALLPLAPALAQSQPQDTEFAKLVREWTTKPEFLSPLVDHLPKVAGIPTTKDVLGYYVGTPKKLTRVADLNRYYRALAAASPRVKVLPAGATDENRECLVIAISDEANIR